MSIISLSVPDGENPSAAELVAIELEWPLIAAELDLLNAEIAILTAGPLMSVLDRRRIRRAEHRVLAARLELADHTDAGQDEVAS
ncbi:DUF6284 family protein [Kribbella sp. NBC_01245]|uniref:DUF6284 family protein n=1 Tax=Kribbella sp. NBC_01245 TaxID=2903578 RepID=UPI002E2B0073|nr:DUF6284 family protein [Kribbella sp. NBC_01245]